MTIFVTEFDPVTKQITTPSTDSGFPSLEVVEALIGKPLVSGKRTRTYPGYFYSDYNLSTLGYEK